MKFERRDGILLAGAALFGVGLAAFLAPIFAIMGAVAVFFGIKAYSARRAKDLLGEAGLGVCAECGAILEKNGCPRCR